MRENSGPLKECVIREALMQLRIDAAERGMLDAAITYGDSAIRIGNEILADHLARLMRLEKRND